MATKTKMGRPSKFAESLVKAKEYLMGGYETVGDVVPSVAGLACYLGVSRKTVYEWVKESTDLSDTLEGILAMQENKLINKGLNGDFNPTITKLMLANHGYSEKQEVDHKSSDSSMSPTKIVLVAGGNNDGSED
ncbi:DNA-packaging protein [Providencia rettgeri]|uniref:DNA-packaging protein n=1 Tax=Providencia TaxID=586 RepID=UPI00206FC1BA|nr:DNA-packaging protein [Providencia rettgeri]ELR5064812.1 DNA-packaging protein [Providencia rettgeri]UPS64218.1 DNA-packaging protein [Providencia rettgeri]